MARSHTFFFQLPVRELEQVALAHQKDFDALLEDSFSESEILTYEALIDSIAAVYVQPMIPDLTFDDFYSDPQTENLQRAFFNEAKSSICLENIPYFEGHPFQVTYLKMFLEKLSEVLIDQGGVSQLTFKKDYLKELSKYKDIESLIPKSKPIITHSPKPILPVDPIDFLIQDVYKELDRLKAQGKEINASEKSSSIQTILKVMTLEKLDSTELLRKTKLGAKAFDDSLESAKFWLKKL